MVYGTYNELVTGASVNQLITGGPHIVWYGISKTHLVVGEQSMDPYATCCLAAYHSRPLRSSPKYHPEIITKLGHVFSTI